MILMNGKTPRRLLQQAYDKKDLYGMRCYILIENIQVHVFKVVIQILGVV